MSPFGLNWSTQHRSRGLKRSGVFFLFSFVGLVQVAHELRSYVKKDKEKNKYCDSKFFSNCRMDKRRTEKKHTQADYYRNNYGGLVHFQRLNPFRLKRQKQHDRIQIRK